MADIDYRELQQDVLLVRGQAVVDEMDHVPDEHRKMQVKYYSEEQAAAVVAGLEEAGTRMAVIAVTPTWVATMDFRTRFPGALADASHAG
jgi:hypothetical protein